MIFIVFILSILFGLGILLFVVLTLPWFEFLLDKFKIKKAFVKYYDWCDKNLKNKMEEDE